MEVRVNWRMEYEVHSWILQQEKLAADKKTSFHSPILELETTRDEVVRNLLMEIEAHDGPFGSSSAPESIL